MRTLWNMDSSVSLLQYSHLSYFVSEKINSLRINVWSYLLLVFILSIKQSTGKDPSLRVKGTTWRVHMCLCLHHLQALLSSIPLGPSLFPAQLLWSHLHTTQKAQRRVGLITITIIALPILLVETHHQRGVAEIMMVKILFCVVPEST